MIRYGILATILLLAVTAVTATFRSGAPAEISGSRAPLTSITGQGDIEERLASLENALREERQIRVRMEETLADLVEQNPALLERESATDQPQARAANLGEVPFGSENIREQITQRRNNDSDAGDRQMERLVAAGFDEYRAADIVRMQEETQMRLLNARFSASQTGDPVNLGELQYQATQEMKTTLGEADYEKYLQATRQPTAVDVRNVLESSPAQIAGLQSGDQIIRYGGERVYNLNELNRLTNSATPFGNVSVEVLRDGQPISLSLPAGPIGITSGRGGF